jgi:glycosyltransferase involved in cell wall biosynthesis
MASGRIYYVCPDIAIPSGGVKRLYRHVHLLNRLGFDAVLVHGKRPFCVTWHGYQVPTTWLSEFPALSAGDVVVSPDTMPSVLRALRHSSCQRVVLALAWVPSLLRLEPGESWSDYGVREVITPSPVIAEYVSWAMGLKTTILADYVDPSLYFHKPGEKSDSIVYISRKDPAGDILRAARWARSAPFDRFQWVPCKDLAQVDYARALRAARVYLPPSAMEGSNTSVLEAMACGCIVVGYNGVGGRAYMRGAGLDQNCVLVDNGDLPAFGPALESVLRLLASDGQAFAPIIANALATASPYQDEEAESRSLAGFYSRLMDPAVVR